MYFLVEIKHMILTLKTGVCRMNHDAKHTGGIFRRRPSTASTSSRLSVQSRSTQSMSCPTSPRHAKYLPANASSTSLNTVLNPTSSNMHGGNESSRLCRSSSSYSNNTKQRPGYNSYTG